MDYQKSYPKKRLDKAYRRFVDGTALLKDLTKSAGVSLRTLQTYSARDGWVAEREARKTELAETAQVAAQLAATASESEIETQLAANPDLKAAILAVMKRQQVLYDRLMVGLERAFESVEKSAASDPRGLTIQRLLPIAKLVDLITTGQRKAYGIPDVSKIEWEDKTPAAKRHADVIRQKRLERLAKAAQAPAQKEVSH